MSTPDLFGNEVVQPVQFTLAETTPEAPYATVEIDLAFARASKTTYPRYVPE